MNSKLKVLATVLVFGGILAIDAQDRSTPQEREGKAENGLVGVDLFDTGLSLLDRFGSPNDIMGLSLDGQGVGPGGGFGGRAGGGGTNQRAGGGGGGSAGEVGLDLIGDPFSPKDRLNVQGGAFGGPAAAGGGGQDGPPAGGGGGGGGAAASTTAENRILYTRWIYNRPTSRYGFIMDKFQRVIQIEAVGLVDSSVRTSRGIRFGSTFEDVIRAHNVPDAYEIAGESMVLRYLVRDHVAFRMSKVDPKEPHQVTGIVVSAGKQ